MTDHEYPDALVIDSDAPAAEEATPPKKRKASTSPTQRTLAECRKRGWTAQVVERWNQHARVKQDLFGVIDVVAIVPPGFVPVVEGVTDGNSWFRPGAILAIQACSGGDGTRGSDHAARRDKILAEPRARLWVEAGGRLELWSWSKRGDRGKRKLWTLRVEAFTAENWRST